MSTTTPAARTAPARLAARLPQRLSKATMALAVASLASEIGIIVTGGAVRLTGSGLGCPTWPKCSPESLNPPRRWASTATSNSATRTLTFVLVVIAAAMFLSLWNLRGTHRNPFWLSVGLLAGIPAQALVGGVVVLTNLNPWWVAGHFIVSSIMVAVATLLVVRIAAERRAGRAGVPLVDGATTGRSRAAAWAAFALTWAAVYLGTVVTSAQTHLRLTPARRATGFDRCWSRVPVVPVYLLLAATLVLFFTVRRAAAHQRMLVLRLLLALVFQAAVGYTQHFTGLPIGVVLLHMLGSPASRRDRRDGDLGPPGRPYVTAGPELSRSEGRHPRAPSPRADARARERPAPHRLVQGRRHRRPGSAGGGPALRRRSASAARPRTGPRPGR